MRDFSLAVELHAEMRADRRQGCLRSSHRLPHGLLPRKIDGPPATAGGSDTQLDIDHAYKVSVSHGC